MEWLARIPLSMINAFLIGIAFINLVIVGITCNKFLKLAGSNQCTAMTLYNFNSCRTNDHVHVHVAFCMM